MSRNTLLINVTAIKERTGVHLNMDEKLLFPEIKAVQDIEITPALGSGLYARLLDGVEADDLTADENTLIDDYLADTLINFVLAALPLSSSYQFFSKGVLRRNTDNAETPSMADLVDLSNHYRNRAEWYRERMVNYLRTNRELYTLYTTYNDDINPTDSGYSLPCALDDEYCGCREEPYD